MAQYNTHAEIGNAAKLPVDPEKPILTYSPVVLPSPGRAVDLQIKVSAPATGENLPIVLVSHGHGPSLYLSSLHGYGPLREFLAGHGFVVLQATHLNSRKLGLKEHPEGSEMGWKSRPSDIVQILDELDKIEEAVPFIRGRLDKSKIAVAGHSFGAWTACLLLGATNTDPRDGSVTKALDKRIKTGVVYGGIGDGKDLSKRGRGLVPFCDTDFTTMTAPALIVCGDMDVSPHLTDRGADWHADPYSLAPGPKDLLWVKGGVHGFGGISGWDAAETTDESPERMHMVLRMTLAYLKSQLYEGDRSWVQACETLKGLEDLGSVESKIE
ncbi:hypothetical protein S40288_02307 [Stachybotrys chartarum IBT 40288]|nr:hypothetical protein S40288_02307 [Stachybotrys chartarum IBT 40288]